MTITVLIRGTTGPLVWKCVHGQSLSQLSLLDDTGRLTKLINQAQLSRYLPKPRLKSLLARNLEYVLDLFSFAMLLAGDAATTEHGALR
jgi:hypothetical protein